MARRLGSQITKRVKNLTEPKTTGVHVKIRRPIICRYIMIIMMMMMVMIMIMMMIMIITMIMMMMIITMIIIIMIMMIIIMISNATEPPIQFHTE